MTWLPVWRSNRLIRHPFCDPLRIGCIGHEWEIEGDRQWGTNGTEKSNSICTCMADHNRISILLYQHTICIHFIDHILKFCFCWVLSKRPHYCSQFLCGDCTISILVKQWECFFEFCKPEMTHTLKLMLKEHIATYMYTLLWFFWYSIIQVILDHWSWSRSSQWNTLLGAQTLQMHELLLNQKPPTKIRPQKALGTISTMTFCGRLQYFSPYQQSVPLWVDQPKEDGKIHELYVSTISTNENTFHC